jgi:signal transduction histidine kinase
MAKVSFNVDAYTARLIGRENVAKLNGAILELVKNTYDADASVCFLYYDAVNQSLYIGDNGTGMTRDTIAGYWMTIGLSTKKRSFISNSGRIQTGAKGIGRFALDRIADRCEMLTSSDAGSFIWTVDWRDFEREGAITDVSANLDKVIVSFAEFLKDAPNEHVKELVKTQFADHGTVFKLSLLRDTWGSARMEDIKNELSTLIPHELSEVFNIFLFDNNTTIEDAAVLHNNDAFSFDYKMDFDVFEDGNTKIQIWRNEFDFGSKFEYIMENAGFSAEDKSYFTGTPIRYDTTFSELIAKDRDKISNTVGSFRGSLYFAKLQTPASERQRFYYKDIAGRKDYMTTFGGIKIYRDQFRVRPYGEPNTSNFDWLQLSGRKNSSPAAVSDVKGAWRVRGDQMLGAVYISRVNITLPDQANREGIVETPEFNLLKKFLLNAIQLFERDRQYVCRKLNDLYKRETEAETYRKEIEEKAKAEARGREKSPNISGSMPATAGTMVEAGKAQKVIESREETIRNLEDENRLLRVLATTGIATNSYIHEFKEQTHRLSMKIIMAKEALAYDNDQEEALRQLAVADQIRTSFTSWFRVTVESIRRDKRSLKMLNLNEFVSQLCEAWKQIVSDKGIKIVLEIPDDAITYRCFPYEIEIILNNLITNSVGILGSLKSDDRTIRITLLDKSKVVLLAYSDSGPGLTSVYKAHPELILEPFESGKANDLGEPVGTGMGMWLIKRTVSDYNGNIDLSRNITESVGFFCDILLPKV